MAESHATWIEDDQERYRLARGTAHRLDTPCPQMVRTWWNRAFTDLNTLQDRFGNTFHGSRAVLLIGHVFEFCTLESDKRGVIQRLFGRVIRPVSLEEILTLVEPALAELRERGHPVPQRPCHRKHWYEIHAD